MTGSINNKDALKILASDEFITEPCYRDMSIKMAYGKFHTKLTLMQCERFFAGSLLASLSFIGVVSKFKEGSENKDIDSIFFQAVDCDDGLIFKPDHSSANISPFDWYKK